MTSTQRKRLIWVFLLVVGVAISAALALKAFRENIMHFYGPSQVAAGEAPQDARFRLGGLVLPGSLKRVPNSLEVSFVLTDTKAQVPVVYRGILPDLFREGQGIVSHGRFDEQGRYVADTVLAKHDENYMSPEVAEALQAAGYDPATHTDKAQRDFNKAMPRKIMPYDATSTDK